MSHANVNAARSSTNFDLDAAKFARMAQRSFVTRNRTAPWREQVRADGTACISDEVGIRKPDPEIFRLAISRCGRNPDGGGWVIGDNLCWMSGAVRPLVAKRSGCSPERRPESWSFVGPAPDFTVDSVAEAIEVLLGSM